jgi:phage terminase large subunit-like protein
MTRDAKAMPSRLAAYRRLVLNQRVEASSPFITQAQWQDCAGAPLDLTGRDVFGGLDLSATQDLTALVLVARDVTSGIWHVAPTFWLPSEGLHDKARTDKIPYDQWRDEGFLETTPGSTVSYEFVAHYLRDVFDQHRVARIGFDRWNIQHLRPWLLNAGFSEQLIEQKFVPFGQGYKAMSPALRDLESLILEAKLRHGGHPVLQMCVSNAVVVRDDAGNRKLSKKNSVGKIDGLVALTMAIGAAAMRTTVQFDVEALIA